MKGDDKNGKAPRNITTLVGDLKQSRTNEILSEG